MKAFHKDMWLGSGKAGRVARRRVRRTLRKRALRVEIN